MASQLLIQFGADVVKVENPRSGDGLRTLEPLINGYGLFHSALNSGARSLAIDHRSSDWRSVVDACCQWADAVIVGGRPVDAVRRGLDYATLTKANPALVYCAITGYGETGPWAPLPAHGLNVDAYAGLVPVEWMGSRPEPISTYQSVGAPLAGVFAALGILAALRERDHGMGARYVHVSLWEAAMWFNWRHTTSLANLHKPWLAYKDLGARYAIYGTSDNRAILVCPTEQRFWEEFCDLAELPAAWKKRGSWVSNQADYGYEDEAPEIARRIALRPLSEWVQALSRRDIPFSPVLSIGEALESDQAKVLGIMATTEIDKARTAVPASPVRIAESSEAIRRPLVLPPPPTLGQDTAKVLDELGLGSSKSVPRI